MHSKKDVSLTISEINTRMNKHIPLFLFLFCVSFVGNSQVKFVNEFLNIGVGARSHGMFSSVAASTSGPSASYWNAAGLSGMRAPLEVEAMHTPWFGGLANYDYISIAKRFSGEREAAGGLTIIRMAVDNIPNTLHLVAPDGSINYDAITEFSAADYAGLISYGQRLGSTPWRIGGAVKVIHRRLGSFGQSWGFGTDLGLQYRGKNLKFGVVIRDITTTFNTWNFNLSEREKNVFLKTGNAIPKSSQESTLPRAILGLGYHMDLSKKFSVYVEGDAQISTDGTKAGLIASEGFAIDPSLGIEIGYGRMVFVRAGIGNIQRLINSQDYTKRDIEYQPNIGVGIDLGSITIDYALANIGNTSSVNQSHIISAKLRFMGRKSKKKEE